jgi:hypothetical protein
MLQLSPDQLEPLERLQRVRAAEGLARVMASAWPEVAERLQARWPAFVATALEQAHQLGLHTLAEQARFASLCCLWGVGFVGKPGFEWAQAIAQAPGLSPALRLHQLTHHSRHTLAERHAAAGPGTSVQALPPSTLDQALTTLERGMGSAGAAHSRSVFIDEAPIAAPRACDIGSLSWAVVPPKPLLRYAWIEGQWQREPAPGPDTTTSPATTTWQQAPSAEEAAEPIPVLSRPASNGEGPGARLNLALKMLAQCEQHQGAERHPVVQHHSAQGRLHWAGPDTQRLSLALHTPAATAPQPGDAPTGIGWGAAPDLHTVAFKHCGIRDAGAPFGTADLRLRVHDASQACLTVRHSALPTVTLPGAGPGRAQTDAHASHCALARDGQPQDSSTWLRAWAQLQPQCRAGLERLFNAWGLRVIGPSARLEGDVAPMVGQASATWGWQYSPAAAPTGARPQVGLHVSGQFDWAALVLDLRLSGTIELGGAQAQLSLSAQGRTDWRMTLQQSGLDDQPSPGGQSLAEAVCSWRHPFSLSLDPVAGTEPGMLSALPLPAPLQGALTGQCGLRPRPDGQGWQWFYKLQTEAVHALLCLHDPVLGQRQQQRELLPALTLIDWSAG